MKSLIGFFIRYPVMVNLVILLMLLAGVVSFSQTRYTLDPSEEPKEIYVDITWRGASPQEVEQRVIARIEERIHGISGIDRFTSQSRENGGRLTVELFERADIDRALNDVENAVHRISDYPPGMDPPVVHKQEILNPTITVALTGDVPLQELKDHANRIRNELMLDGGVNHVNLLGLPEEEIVIELRQADLDRYRLTYAEIAAAVRQSNLDVSGGEIQTAGGNWKIRAREQHNSAAELARTPLRVTGEGERLLLGDVAEVSDRFAEQPVRRYLNGEPSVSLQILTGFEEDLVATAAYVRSYSDQFNRVHEDVQLHLVEDISEFVNERAASLWENGLLGLILVLFMLSIFLDRRIAFWVALTIPVSLMGTFILAMAGYDLTINVVSIFGFILVLGMLVDTGVVVTENVYRHYAEFGSSPIRAAREGAAEVALPMITSLLTTAVAFSIFFFLPGRPGAFFSEISFVVIGSLLSALLVAFLLLPAKLTRSKVMNGSISRSRLERLFSDWLTALRDRYFLPFTERLVTGGRWPTVTIFVLLLGASVGLIRTGLLPVTFFPYLDDDIQLITLRLEPGTPIDTTHARLIQIEEAVGQVNRELTGERVDRQPVVRNVERILGPNSHQGALRVIMMGGEERKIPSYDINNRFRRQAGTVEGARVIRFLGATAEHRFGGLPIDISLSGNSLEQLREAAGELRLALQQRVDLTDVADNDQRGNPELEIHLTPAGEQLGLTLQELMDQIRGAFFGLEVQTVQRGYDDIRIVARSDKAGRRSISDLQQMKIRTPQGSYPLQEVASIHPNENPVEINRTNGRRTIRVDADLAHPSVSAPAILGELEQELLPGLAASFPGISYTIEGQNRESQQVTAVMRQLAPLLLLLIVSLVVVSFQSFLQAFLVLITLPFTFIGVVFGHLLHGVPLSIFSLIGTIALIGILINNMLVLITAFNDNLRQGQRLSDALMDATRSRFRPILLTTMSTVAGLTPMIFLGGLASAFLRPPAIAIAYGLLFGLLISLVLVPTLLLIANRLKTLYYTLRGSVVSAESVEPAVLLRQHQNRCES